MPGEITLAHRGVLFLDELPEFDRAAVDALRQPLEDGLRDDHARPAHARVPGERDAGGRLQPLPVRAAAGPLHVHARSSWARYLRRLSGPLLDRIDLVCQVEQAPPLELVGGGAGRRATPAAVRERVLAARERQQARLAGTGALCNGDMDGRLTRARGAAGRGARAAACWRRATGSR